MSMITLLLIRHDEVAGLLESPLTIRGMPIYEEALPPPFVLSLALEQNCEWTIPRLFVDETENAVVGSGGFKRPPADAQIEIGYGVATRCRGRGVATEGVRQLVAEAFGSAEVAEVIAETAVHNLASRRVLQKIGFEWVGQSDDVADGLVDCWSLKKTPAPTLSARR